MGSANGVSPVTRPRPANAGARGRGRSVDRLQRALQAVAAGGYAGVEDEAMVQAVEEGLRAVVDDDGVPREVRSALADVLRRWERAGSLGRIERTALVAEAQRLALALRLAGAPDAPPRRSRPRASTHNDVAAAEGAAIQGLPGVGPATLAKLAERGIASLDDLAHWLPVAYQDRRQRPRLADLAEGEVAVLEGEVVSFRRGFRGRGRAMATLVFRPAGEGGDTTIEARWFHAVGGLAQKAVPGARLLFIGAVREFRGRPSMIHPEVRRPDDPGPAISVRYPNVDGVGDGSLAKWCRAAVGELRRLHPHRARLLPPPLIDAHDLMSDYFDALSYLHAPADDLDHEALRALQERRSAAHRRLAFEHLFFLQLTLLQARDEWRQSPCSWSSVGEGMPRETLRAALPFEPTAAQWRVLAEVEGDLASGRPMLRLLQGDVGSGKTVVAFGAALCVAVGGGQVAVMAPTEVLARQHLETLTPWCETAGLRVGLLTGSMPRAQRTSLLSLVEAGRVDVLVGTHALLVNDVRFRRLGLVVVDEQHRFGVEQRARLRDKGSAPHLLVMTATPIPRTLALTVHGDLDLSVLDELPPGRQPVETRVFAGRSGLSQARKALAKVVMGGAQAFVVCPLVEASEALDVSDVDATARALTQQLPGVTIEVVHGRLAAKDKAAVMERVRSGETRVLVATTVIEVGVDVAGAEVILIEHAERFGLAQLHQLRGRVGRRSVRSSCLVHTGSGPGSEAAQRLAVLRDTHDGFVLAERDLALRGPGDLFGTQQTGAAPLTFDARWVVAVRAEAARLLEQDPGLQNAVALRSELARRGIRRPYAAEAG